MGIKDRQKLLQDAGITVYIPAEQGLAPCALHVVCHGKKCERYGGVISNVHVIHIHNGKINIDGSRYLGYY